MFLKKEKKKKGKESEASLKDNKPDQTIIYEGKLLVFKLT